MREIDIRQRTNGLAISLLAMGLVRRPEEQKLLRDGPGEEEPEFVKPTDGHLFDINSNSTGEVTKVVLEELKTRKQTERVTNSEPVRRKDVKFSEYNVHARAEWKATQRSFKLAEKNNLIFWISAEDGAMGLSEEEAKKLGFVYGDGRFNICFKTVENGEIVLKGKHIPLGIDRFKSFELGKRLVEYGGETIGKIDTVEDLRVQPIGFNLENQNEWLNECRKMIPELEEFWEAIENGDDLKKEEEMTVIVEIAKKVAKGNNVVFQLELLRNGIEITSGNHGVGYLGKQNNGMFSFEIKKVGNQFYTEPVIDGQGNLICPVCGARVATSESKCGKCGIGLRKSDN